MHTLDLRASLHGLTIRRIASSTRSGWVQLHCCSGWGHNSRAMAVCMEFSHQTASIETAVKCGNLRVD